MSLKESDIKKQVVPYLRLKGWFVFPIMQGALAYRGISDLIAIKQGRVLFVELKTAHGVLSDYQKKFQEDITTHGGEYLVIRSVEDLETVEI